MASALPLLDILVYGICKEMDLVSAGKDKFIDHKNNCLSRELSLQKADLQLFGALLRFLYKCKRARFQADLDT